MRKTKNLGFTNKMKIFVVSLGLLLCATAIYAQEQKYDMIIKSDGAKIEAKVLYIESDVVKYKKINNLDGPTYSLNQDDIATILYANGTVDVFQKKSPSEKYDPTALQSSIKTCDELQADFERAQRLKQKGVGLLVSGFSLLVGGGILCGFGATQMDTGLGMGLFIGGATVAGIGWWLILPGAIVTGIGNGKLKRISNEMYEICSIPLNRGGKYPMSLSFATNGLALRF